MSKEALKLNCRRNEGDNIRWDHGAIKHGKIALFLANIQIQSQHLVWGAGRPMESGVGVKGSTEIARRMTNSRWGCRAIKHGNIAQYLAAIHLKLDEHFRNILKYSERGDFAASHTLNTLIKVGSLWRAVIPYETKNCHNSRCSDHEVGLPGVRFQLRV